MSCFLSFNHLQLGHAHKFLPRMNPTQKLQPLPSVGFTFSMHSTAWQSLIQLHLNLMNSMEVQLPVSYTCTFAVIPRYYYVEYIYGELQSLVSCIIEWVWWVILRSTGQHNVKFVPIWSVFQFPASYCHKSFNGAC
jgi:hypothetical protein